MHLYWSEITLFCISINRFELNIILNSPADKQVHLLKPVIKTIVVLTKRTNSIIKLSSHLWIKEMKLNAVIVHWEREVTRRIWLLWITVHLWAFITSLSEYNDDAWTYGLMTTTWRVVGTRWRSQIITSL